MHDVFETLKERTSQFDKLQSQLTYQNGKIQEVYIKKKKYKQQSQALVSKVQNLTQGLAYYSKWNEALK